MPQLSGSASILLCASSLRSLSVMAKFARTTVARDAGKVPDFPFGPCVDLCYRIVAGSAECGNEAGAIEDS